MKEPVHFKVVYEQHTDGSYQAWVPALPACQAQGASMSQVKERIEEAVYCYCLNMQEHGAPIPHTKPGASVIVDEIQLHLGA